MLGRWRARLRTVIDRMPKRQASTLVASISVIVWLAWFIGSVVPEWTGARANPGKVQKDYRDRVMVEAGYGAAWLTRYWAAHGALPEVLPRNPASRGNRQVVDLCPTSEQDLVRADADWAFCKDDGKFRALARHITLVVPDGGAQVPLTFTQNGTP